MQIRTSLLALGTLALASACSSKPTVSAEGLGPFVQPNAGVTVDCSDFQKQPSGAWKVLHASNVGIGASVYNTYGSGGYLVPGLRQSDGTNIYGAVDRACGKNSSP